MAAAITATTPAGQVSRPRPLAAAPSVAEADGAPSAFEALLADQQQVASQGGPPSQEEARAAVEPAVAHAVRRGASRGRGIGEQGDEPSTRADSADDPAPNTDAVVQPVPGATLPVVVQSPQAAGVAAAAVVDRSPLPSAAAAPAGRWRGEQMPDGIVLPPPVPADTGPGAEVTTAVAPDTGVDGTALADAPQVPIAEAQTSVSAFAAAVALSTSSSHTPPAVPGAEPDVRDAASVTPAEIAALARDAEDVSGRSSRDADDPGSESGRGSGFEQATSAGGHQAPVVQTLPATDPASRAPAAPPVPGAPAQLPDDHSLASQIVQRMRLQWTAGAGTAVVTLDPEYLGAVTINLRVDGSGAMTATLSADNADVRAWMQAHEPALRQQLAEQGLSLDRLQVSDEHPRGDEAPADERRRRWQPPAPPPPKRTAGGTFAVVV